MTESEQTVKYLAVGSQDWKEARRKESWKVQELAYNVRHKDGTETSIDWKNDVQEWHAIKVHVNTVAM